MRIDTRYNISHQAFKLWKEYSTCTEQKTDRCVIYNLVPGVQNLSKELKDNYSFAIYSLEAFSTFDNSLVLVMKPLKFKTNMAYRPERQESNN